MDTKALRQKILDLAIHGKLVPQDPNDEPASVLLERIRAEKERLIKEGKIKKGKKSAKTSDKPHYPHELPKGWCFTNIGELLINRDGERKPVSSAIRNKLSNKIYDYYGAAGVIDKIDDYLFDEKLLLIGEDGANLLSKSKNNAFFAEGKYWVNNHAHVLDATDKNLLEYVAIVINAIKLDDYITGSAQPKLSQDNLNKIPIALPPLSEQKRIMEAIIHWSLLIEQIEQNKIDLQASIKQTKSKVLDLAIHGKLVQQDPNDEPASELLKRINPTAEIVTDNGHYQKLPEGWTICKLKDICSKLVDGDHNPPKGTKETTGYLMLSAQNIVNDNIVYTNGVRYLNHDAFETSDKRTKVMQGDLLITIVGTLGRSCVFSDNKKITLQRSVACLTPLIYNHYLKYYMDSSSIQKNMTTNAKGTAQKGFYLNQLEQLPIMIPPLTEQQRIVARIKKIFTRLDDIESAL